MKIIQVVGKSNSGKTTFIKHLIPELKKKGKVAVVKHLAGHNYRMEEGKDTTVFFDAGAEISIGIDSHKAFIAIRGKSLHEVFRILCDQDVDFAIIEGFKQYPYPKIVIGDLAIEKCILKNPSVGEVIDSLDLFEIYQMKL
jgi:molybdopterin-guanine dinucleotide biosynthesis protein MobB